MDYKIYKKKLVKFNILESIIRKEWIYNAFVVYINI